MAVNKPTATMRKGAVKKADATQDQGQRRHCLHAQQGRGGRCRIDEAGQQPIGLLLNWLSTLQPATASQILPDFSRDIGGVYPKD